MRKRKRPGRYINLSDNSLGEFRILPKFPGIRIYASGLIVRESDSKVLESVNGSGYVCCVLTDVNGVRTGHFNHRLVAYAFLDPPDNADELEVNHKDFNKLNNAKDNLEWATTRDNRKHSGFNDPESGIKFKPIQVRDFDTGEVRTYETMIDCSRDLNVHKDSVQMRAAVGDSRLWENRLQYRLYSGDTPWCENPTGAFVQVLDIFNGKVVTFKSSDHAATEYGVSAASMSMYLNRKKGFPFKNQFIAKYEHDKTPWPVIGNPIEYIANNTQQAVVEVENATTGDRRLFLRAVECAIAMRLKPSALNMRLKSGKTQHVYPDGNRYRYFSPAK